MLIRLIWTAVALMCLLLAAPVWVAGQDKSEEADPAKKPALESAEQDGDDAAGDAEDEDDADDEPTAASTMAKAIEAVQSGDIDKAIEWIEAAHKLDAEDPRIAMTMIGALQARAMELVEADKRAEANKYFYKAANFVRGLEGDLAAQVGRRSGEVFYNEACAYSVDGKTEEAIESLAEAFERGFEDFELTRSDADFASLRDNAQFVALVEKHERLMLERLVAETKAEVKEFESYDFDFALKDLDGDDVKLGDFAGKLVIVDFWGTWCPPCRAEIPHFVKLQSDYAEKGLSVVGLSYEQGEDDEVISTVKEFVDEHKINYTCLIGDEETLNKVPDFQGYPTTLFIDRKGVVRLQLVGAQPHAKLEAVVKELLGEQ
jgi:thiol-disulfide isomerase/thioredoxin